MQAINGCGVLGHTFSGTVTGADMIVTIPAITCWVPDGSGGKVYVSYAGGDVTITAAHATLPRTDIIVIDSAGTCTATAGTATAETGDVEEAPTAALVNDEIMIAKVRVAAAVTVIGTDRVVGRAIDVSENHLGFTTKGADITSTAALPLPDAGQYFDVTGASTITSIESRPAGFLLALQFDSALILTHNATTLILSGAANITTAAGDVFVFVSEGSGNWRQTSGPVFSAFDGIRNHFRANRRLIAEYSAQNNTAAGTSSAAGIGFVQNPVNFSDIVAVVSGEPVMQFSVAAAGAVDLVNSASYPAILSPAKSPRMLMRVLLPAASANNTYWVCGFISADAIAAVGAFLRIVTTGNVFFVTDNAGTETTTDLGVLSRVAVLGFEIESVDDGVTWVCRNQAGTVLATHTTNVPDAATGLQYGMAAQSTTGAVVHGVAYLRVEATIA